jgi:phosphatidylglycerophosphate synthase
MVRTVRSGPTIGLIAGLVLIAALAGTVGLSPAGWLVGVACAVITNVALTRALDRAGAAALGPADRVTLTRAALVGGVAALASASFATRVPVETLVSITVVALVLDAVDGWVARRTETASALGARFDMEVDAFLIFVLSVYVAREIGAWVLVIGAARYTFVVAGWLLPWMRGSLPPRYWRKVVAAIQGVALTFAALDVLSPAWTNLVIAASLALLTESFGRDVWWLRRHVPADSRVNRIPVDSRMHTVGHRRVRGTRVVVHHAFSPVIDGKSDGWARRRGA